MKTLADQQNTLGQGLADIRRDFQVPVDFPPAVLAAANAAAARAPSDHVDRTRIPFVTLDPASSTDLDQAFAIERGDGDDLLLHYAIADVGWFVTDGDPIDAEAWRRGTTLYLPDGKAGLYPPVLAEGAASLLPDGPRPAIVFTVRVADDGGVLLRGAERAVIRSRAKLAYATVTDADLPRDFVDLAARIVAAEKARGAARVDPPEQEVKRTDDGFALAFRPRLVSEDRNAALSLATNMAVADALQAHGTGLFRVMPGPDAHAIERLRHTAVGLGIDWPAAMTLDRREHDLDPADPRQAALMMAIRRVGGGASYAPYREGVVPWHAAMAATYAHATAPLRRFADRYVVMAALAVANGRAVPAAVEEAFPRLPAVMARADALGGRIDRAVIDLAEAVMLAPRVGETFAAVVTDLDAHGARLQLCDLAVVARVDATDMAPGDPIRVTLTAADPAARTIRFALAT